MTLVEEMVLSHGSWSGVGGTAHWREIPEHHALPPCIGLAVLSAVRFMAHFVMALQLERGRAEVSTHPAMVLGSVFEL